MVIFTDLHFKENEITRLTGSNGYIIFSFSKYIAVIQRQYIFIFFIDTMVQTSGDVQADKYQVYLILPVMRECNPFS